MRCTLLLLITCCLSALCWTSLCWADGHEDLPQPIGHRDLILPVDHWPDSPEETWTEPGLTTLTTAPGPAVSREVIAYLPYWEMGYVPQRWDLVTILAWFGVAMDSNGDITDWNGWGGADTESLVAQAHAHGVKVIVTVTNFDDASVGTLLSSESRRNYAIERCLELMAVHDADGINIDFEFVPKSARDDFVIFMRDLTAAVRAKQPRGGPGHVSLAGPSVDWSGAYDYDQLLIHSDGIMVMAYGYHWSGGSPGPTSPLYGGGVWGQHSIAWTIDDYLTWGGLENRHRVYIGLPWYGRQWRVANTQVPGQALANGVAVFMEDALAEVASWGRLWDEATQTPYYHRESGGALYQVWYDDVESLRAKIGYVDAQDLGGIGIWALGYDGDYEAPWLAIEQVLSDDEVTVPDIDAGASTDASTTPVDAGAATDGHGVDTWVSDNGPMLDESVSNGTDGSDNGQEPQGPSSSLSPVAQVTGMSAHSRQRTPIDDGCAMSAGSTPHSAWLCVLLALATIGHRRRRVSDCSGLKA